MARIDGSRGEVLRLLKQKQPHEAISLCDSALSSFEASYHSRIIGYRAWAEWNGGRTDDAIRSIHEAREMDPAWAGHIYQLAFWLLELGRLDEAQRTAEQLIDLEQKRGSMAFADSARFVKAYALVFSGRLKS